MYNTRITLLFTDEEDFRCAYIDNEDQSKKILVGKIALQIDLSEVEEFESLMKKAVAKIVRKMVNGMEVEAVEESVFQEMKEQH